MKLFKREILQKKINRHKTLAFPSSRLQKAVSRRCKIARHCVHINLQSHRGCTKRCIRSHDGTFLSDGDISGGWREGGRGLKQYRSLTMNSSAEGEPPSSYAILQLPEQYQTSPFFIVSMDLQQITHY
jgi:hypothetical protein